MFRSGACASGRPTGTVGVATSIQLLVVMLVNTDAIAMVIRPEPRRNVGVGTRAPARRLAEKGRGGVNVRRDSAGVRVGSATAWAVWGADEKSAAHGVPAGAWTCTAKHTTTARRPRSPRMADEAGHAHVAHVAAGNAATVRATSCGKSRAAPGGDGGLPTRGWRAPVEGLAGGRTDKPSAREPEQRGNQARCYRPSAEQGLLTAPMGNAVEARGGTHVTKREAVAELHAAQRSAGRDVSNGASEEAEGNNAAAERRAGCPK